MKPSFLDQVVGQSLEDFSALSPEQRAVTIRRAVPDLNIFFDEGRPLGKRDAPRRTSDLAASLFDALTPIERDAPARTLDHRIITDELLRGEADRDQNVYLGSLFTRRLTQAVPDLTAKPAVYWLCDMHHGQVSNDAIAALLAQQGWGRQGVRRQGGPPHG